VEVKAFLGHASVKTTERYAKFAGDALMAAKEMNG
jgi:site-specific recombinase XerD